MVGRLLVTRCRSAAVAVAAQVATVLSYAHDVPVVHRDLRLGNLLVTQDGTVKVLDFGIAATPPS
nr:protein kinase [Streptomyces sp. QL37]